MKKYTKDELAIIFLDAFEALDYNDKSVITEEYLKSGSLSEALSSDCVIKSVKEEKLKEAIVNDIKRGITILDGRGGYTDSSKSVLIVAVNKKQEVHMKKLIKNVDKNAFIIVSKAHEVFGEGFSPISA